MDDELKFTAEADPRVTKALRALHAAPRRDEYWEQLHARILSRVSLGARADWMQVAAGWARPGLLAAAAVLLAAAAIFQSGRDDAEPITFAAVAEAGRNQPELIYTEHDAASQRDETLRLVVAHWEE